MEIINTGERSKEWECYLFGSTGSDGLTLHPLKDKEPNWFWRKMQFLLLGNRWVKKELTDVT
jgi:hypothetical protein